MNIRFIIAALVCTLDLTCGSIAHAQMLFAINPDTADAQVSNPNNGTATTFNTTDYQARIGEYFAPGGACYVFPFLLPTLTTGQQFTAASLQFQLFGLGGTPANADLYGLGVRTTSTVLATDYYQGTNDAANTLLQANFLTPSSTVRTDANTGPFTLTSASGNTALVNYLNTVDPNGSKAGQYVFFRVSYDANPIPAGNNYYSLLTDNAGGANEKPVLNLTANTVAGVPEPSTYLLMALAGASLAIFRRRKV